MCTVAASSWGVPLLVSICYPGYRCCLCLANASEPYIPLHWPMYLCAGPLSSFPSIRELSQLPIDDYKALGSCLGLSEDEMGHIRNAQYPSTETFIAAKVKNVELRWNDILRALLSIGKYELADQVCNERGWCWCHG